MNIRLVLHLLSFIFAAIGVAFGFCMLTSILAEEPAHIERMWGMLGMGSLLGSLILWPTTYTHRRQHFFKREAFGTIGLGWICACALGTLPYTLIAHLPLADAFFESTSGLTTTGASVITDIEALPHSLLFWRSLSQWIGGLGIVIFFAAILINLGAGTKLLYTHETSGHSQELESAKAQDGIVHVFMLYLVLSILTFISLLYLTPLDPFDALCHTLTSISTGGFSTFNGSIAQLNSAALEWTLIVIMIIGASSFVLILRMLARPRFRLLARNSELKAYLFAAALGSGTIACLIVSESAFYPHTETLLRKSIFQAVAILTGTGYSSADYNLWPAGTHVVLFVLMTIGGCTTSTAGGLKVLRVVGSIKLIRIELERSFRSNILRPLSMNGHQLPNHFIDGLLRYIAIALVVYIIGLLILSIFEPQMSFHGYCSAAMACMANTGPGQAEVGPFENYADLTRSSKLILSLMMLLGRLEFYAILVLFFPSLWKRLQ